MSFSPGLVAATPLPPPPPDPNALEPVSAPYWRLRLPWSNASIGSYVIEEVEMRATEGGADQCTGGTATASAGTAASAFDDSTASEWLSGSSVNSFSGWLAYQFPAPVQVAEIAVKIGANAANSPRVISLQYSQDGVTWTEWAHWAELAWTARETKVLNAASRRVVPVGHTTLWRINVTANNWRGGVTNYLEINEFELRDADGVNLPPTAGGRVVGFDAQGSSWASGKAFDGIYDSDSALMGATDRLPAWLGYLFPEPVAAIAEAAIRSDTNSTYPPKDFTIEYSNDFGLTWTVVHSTTDQIGWSAFETRVFDLSQPTSRGIRGDWHLDVTRLSGGWVFLDLASAAENVSGGDNDPGFVVSTKPLGTIPRYFEFRIDARGVGVNAGYVGIVEESQRAFYQSAQIADRTNCFGYRENGEIRTSSGVLATNPSYGVGDILMIAYNRTANTVQFGKNGVWGTTRTIAAGTHYAAFGLRDQGDKATLIGNAADFTYSPPPGYSDLEAD